MARPLDPKAVKNRIKDNKVIMKAEKKAVSDAMNLAMKGEAIDAAEVRKSLSVFIKAAAAVKADSEKLAALENSDD